MIPAEGADLLVVEDNPSDLELTLRALRKSDCPGRIHTVKDGEEALDFLFDRTPAGPRPSGTPLKVIFLDLKLPKVDGFEVLRQAKADARTRSIPVVVLTSSLQESDVRECYRLGANSYVVKAVDFTSFSACIAQMAHYWLSLNEPRR